MKSVVILISGRGSNMLSIARACERQQWPAQIRAVISNVADAPGLDAASALGLHTDVLSHRGFSSRTDFDHALAQKIDTYEPDLVVLAGFMRILSAEFVSRYAGRLINIHPSLLPAFTGLNTHQRALDAGVRIHGATVHFVIPELDAGPIIAQAVVPVVAGDTADSLQARVQRIEHELYPAVVRGIVMNDVVVEGTQVRLSGTMRASFGVECDNKTA